MSEDFGEFFAAMADYASVQEESVQEEQESSVTSSQEPPPETSHPPPEFNDYRQKYARYAKKVMSAQSNPPIVPYQVIKNLLQEQIKELLGQTQDWPATILILREIDLAIFEQYLREHDITQNSCIEGICILKHSALLEIWQDNYKLSDEMIPQYLQSIFTEVQQTLQKAINYGLWKTRHLEPLLTPK